MKNLVKISASLILTVALVFCLVACGNNATSADDPWANATYTEDTTFGNGATTFKMVVKVNDNSVTFTVNTDKDTVGAALSEYNLVEATDGMYTKVNGITADYNVDQSYWAFYVNDGYANEGMDTTKIEKDTTYKLEYTK